jgi:hypothetical protein
MKPTMSQVLRPGILCAPGQKWILLLACLVCALFLSACGRGGAPSQDPVQIRDPHPTFTPTPRQVADTPPTPDTAPVATPAPANADTAAMAAPQSAPQAGASEPEAPAQPQPATGGPAPKLIINTALVNLREGPGTDFNVVTIVDRGYELEITGKNSAGDWWRVCCVGEQSGWVAAELGDTDDPVDQVPVMEGGASTAAKHRGGGSQQPAF